MSGRSESYDEFIAEKMRDPEYAREQSKVSIELRGNVADGLRVAIRAMGIKDFAEKSGIPIQNVSEFAQNNKSWGYNRLEKSLAVFGLEFSVKDKKAG